MSITKAFAALILSGVLLGLGAPVLAQSHGHGKGHGGQDKHQNNGSRHDNSRHNDDRRDANRGRGNPHYDGMHDRGRHEGWYKRGGYLPTDYRGSRYVVTDWRHQHLREPPRGYHWVRSDNGDFLLVAVATGLIVELLLNQ